MSEKRLIPNIRFMEFSKRWEQKSLEEILKINSGRDYKHLKYGDIPVYGTGGYMLSVDSKLSDEDAIGIGRKGTINKPQLLKAPFWTVDTLFFLTPLDKNDYYFLFSIANKINWKKYDESTSVPSLSKSTIQKINEFIPFPDEQFRIGKLFKGLDETIQIQQQLLNGHKQLKKAMLQKMFPQKGETVPRVRFAGFTDNWEQRKLSELASHRGGTAIEKHFSESGKYKVISIGSYGTESKYVDQGIRVMSNEVTSKRIVRKNELTMVLNDKTANGTIIGRSLLIESDDEFIINQRTEIISPKNLFDPKFAYVVLNHPFREKVKKIVQGGTQIYVNYSAVENLTITIPLKEEQEKIGDFFKQLDETINLHQKKLETYQELKKAMLQKMFV